MNASPEIISLLRGLQSREIRRSHLATWLAQRSLPFLDSPNLMDRMVVADLDAALGEVQRGVEGEDHLAIIAYRLVHHLLLDLSTLEEYTDTGDAPSVTIVTASASSGGAPISTVEHSYSYA